MHTELNKAKRLIYAAKAVIMQGVREYGHTVNTREALKELQQAALSVEDELQTDLHRHNRR
jgi:hypothetical protein